MRHSERATLQALSAYGERAYPSLKTLSEQTGYCERAIRYALRALEAGGFIETVDAPGRYRPTTYRVIHSVVHIPTFMGAKNAPEDDFKSLQESVSGATVAPMDEEVAYEAEALDIPLEAAMGLVATYGRAATLETLRRVHTMVKEGLVLIHACAYVATALRNAQRERRVG
jgi:hypothetical protein